MNSSVNSITGFSAITSLCDLIIPVNLGVYEDEISVKQDISISFKLLFKNKPQGCYTDKIEDTICYFELSNMIKEYCAGREFKLLEYMCNELYMLIKPKIGSDVKIWIKIDKYPPIQGLRGAACFEYTDAWE